MTRSRSCGILDLYRRVSRRFNEQGRGTMALAGLLHLGWALQMRHRQSPSLDHGALRWYRDATLTYRLMAGYIVPALLKPLARVAVEGLEHIPSTGPVIL